MPPLPSLYTAVFCTACQSRLPEYQILLSPHTPDTCLSGARIRQIPIRTCIVKPKGNEWCLCLQWPPLGMTPRVRSLYLARVKWHHVEGASVLLAGWRSNKSCCGRGETARPSLERPSRPRVPLAMLLFAIIIKIKVIGKPRRGNSTAYWIFNFLEDARGNLEPLCLNEAHYKRLAKSKLLLQPLISQTSK